MDCRRLVGDGVRLFRDNHVRWYEAKAELRHCFNREVRLTACLSELPKLGDRSCDRVVADLDRLRAEGIEVVTAGPDIVNDCVELGVVDLTPEKERRLKKLYGDSVHPVNSGRPTAF